MMRGVAPPLGISLALAAVAPFFGCSAPETEGADDPWVGATTTENGVTTVINEAGGLWGDIELVEEASIGALDGDDPYVFSQVRAVTASEDRIFVLDSLDRVVRVYSMAGEHLFDIGGPGDGPGEFRRPWAIGLSLEPRALVRDLGQNRLHVFSVDGELLEDWPAAGGGPTTIADEGFAYVYNRLSTGIDEGLRFGMVAIGPDGKGETIPIPVFEHERALVPVDRRLIEVGMMQARNQGLPFSVADIPFAPNPQWALASDGTMIWGESDRYLFDVERLDGRRLRVEHASDPVPVGAAERRWYRDRLTRFWREVVPEFVWQDEGIPATKRAFMALIPDRDGRVWVLRELAGVPLTDCDPDPDDFSGFLDSPCWRQPFALDAFGPDGRYLARVRLPKGARVDIPPFIDGNTMVSVSENDAGTIMVKRYRMIAPGEGPR